MVCLLLLQRLRWANMVYLLLLQWLGRVKHGLSITPPAVKVGKHGLLGHFIRFNSQCGNEGQPYELKYYIFRIPTHLMGLLSSILYNKARILYFRIPTHSMVLLSSILNTKARILYFRIPTHLMGLLSSILYTKERIRYYILGYPHI